MTCLRGATVLGLYHDMFQRRYRPRLVSGHASEALPSLACIMTCLRGASNEKVIMGYGELGWSRVRLLTFYNKLSDVGMTKYEESEPGSRDHDLQNFEPLGSPHHRSMYQVEKAPHYTCPTRGFSYT